MQTQLTHSGIYAIVNSVNGKRYIGSGVNLRKRRREHWSALSRGLHWNRFLQASWKKYGAESFEFTTLLLCAKSDLIFYEQRCIDGLSPEYNLSPTAGSPLGFKFSPESRAKLSGRRRCEYTVEHRARLAEAARNRVISPETRAKMAENAKGNKHRLGDRKSPEERAKISASRTGMKFTAEHRANIAASHRGIKPTAEAIKKRAATMASKGPHPWLGRTHTEETRAKMSASAKARVRRMRGEAE